MENFLTKNVVFTSSLGRFVEIVKYVHVSLKVSDWFNYESPVDIAYIPTF